MSMISFETLATYWSAQLVETNLLIFLNLLGALALGLLLGYERSYHGRAAGMRTYGLVCMASAALTVIAGYPAHWFGGQAATVAIADPTRIIQGIVTGVGFLGAGVILKEGLNISGLTTAASIWVASAIGIMVGVGFYASAMLLSVLSAICMMWVNKLEVWLPSRPGISILLRFEKGFVPREDAVNQIVLERGYEAVTGSLAIRFENGRSEWRFVAVALGKDKGAALTELAETLTRFEGVEDFQLSHSRN